LCQYHRWQVCVYPSNFFFESKTLLSRYHRAKPESNYLADVFSKPDGWIETPEADPDADAKPGTQLVYMIDCEMVRALATYSVSYTDKAKMSSVPHRRRQGTYSSCIVDFVTNKVVNINSFNYQVRSQTISLSAFSYALLRALTPDFSFSGIVAQALEPITMTLADAQAHLRTPITPSTIQSILLGHSREFDLRTLQLSHSRCIGVSAWRCSGSYVCGIMGRVHRPAGQNLRRCCACDLGVGAATTKGTLVIGEREAVVQVGICCRRLEGGGPVKFMPLL
jgi:hypothetical protein